MVRVDHRLFSYEDFVLFESDAQSLESTNWLTDNVVNFAVSYLFNQNAEQNPQLRDKVSVIYATLCELIKYTPNEGQQMEALLESVGASPNKWLLFLFNDTTDPRIALSGSHWSLVLFDPNRKQFVLFDPLKIYENVSSHGGAGEVYKFVSKLAVAFGCYSSAPPLVSSLSHPIMRLGGDCGVYIVEYARAILHAATQNNKMDELNFDFGHINSDNIGLIRYQWMEIIRERTSLEKDKK